MLSRKQVSVMTAKEIREWETQHLGHELAEKAKHLYDLRSQAVTEKLEDPSQLRKTRRDVARIKTVMRERQIAQQKAGQVPQQPQLQQPQLQSQEPAPAEQS